ncbi:serine protease grass-like [Drosophila subpulchrella]|uniref:serine protease grass-like n=1 Tax=Drosophila subpulchrella TaxID=1486046 RepID=UPI0018A12F22|nr:serine protease grass-like [Drosophila subpulchrella]
MENKALAAIFLLFVFPLPGLSQFLDPSCGIRTEPKTSKRVINGKIAKYNSSPWMAFLKSTDDRFVCGGTLITNKLVLTAAHCFKPNKTLYAILGEYKRSQQDGCIGNYCHFRAEHKVDAGFKHRLYDPKTHLNDIAVLRLATAVKYRDNIRPICIVLDTKWRQYIDNIQVLIGTGWGKTESEPDSDELRTLDIRRQPPQVCYFYIGSIIKSSQFCAGNWNSNLCNGDSGGPLGAFVPYGNTKRFVQIGIASFTNQRCQKASIFTDVLNHVDFILRVWRQFGNGQSVPVPTRLPTRPTRLPTRPTTSRPPTTLPTRPPTRPPTIPPTTPPTSPPVVPLPQPEPEPIFEDYRDNWDRDSHWNPDWDEDHEYPDYDSREFPRDHYRPGPYRVQFPIQYPMQYPMFFF